MAKQTTHVVKNGKITTVNLNSAQARSSQYGEGTLKDPLRRRLMDKLF